MLDVAHKLVSVLKGIQRELGGIKKVLDRVWGRFRGESESNKESREEEEVAELKEEETQV